MDDPLNNAIEDPQEPGDSAILTNSPMKFDDAANMADAIIDRVGHKIVLALPLGLGKPNRLTNALVRRAIRRSHFGYSRR
jgi:hypothetical protein